MKSVATTIRSDGSGGLLLLGRELQAASSMSYLWQKQGKKQEARHLLTEIYGGSPKGSTPAI